MNTIIKHFSYLCIINFFFVFVGICFSQSEQDARMLGMSDAYTTLVSGYKDAGTYNLTWDAVDIASGMYFVKARANGFMKIQKLMLVK